MEQFINKVNFAHDDEDIYDQYRDKLRDWVSENDETVSVEQLISSLSALGKKFTEGKKYPAHESNGYYQAEELADSILSLISDRISEHAKPKQFQEPCLNLILKFMDYGVGTVHMHLIHKFIRGGDIEMEDYVKTFKGEKLNRLVSALCTPAIKREDTEGTTFYDEYSSYFYKCMDDLFEESQLIKGGCLKTFIEFSSHIYLDYGHLDEESLKEIVHISDNIYRYFDDSWKDYRDVDHLKSILKKITASVKKSGFPQNYEDEMSKRYMLSKVVEIARKKDMAEPFCEDMLGLLEASLQCKCKDEALLFKFIDQVLYYFYHQDKENIKKKPNLFKMAAPKFNQCIERADMNLLIKSRVAPKVMHFLEYTFDDDKQQVGLWVEVGLTLIKRPCVECLSACKTVLRKDELIKWKEHQQMADKMFTAISSVTIPEGEDEEKFADYFSDCVTSFISGLKNSRMIKKYGKGIILLAVRILEMKREKLYEIAKEIAYNFEIDTKEGKDTVIEVLQRLHNLLKDDDMPWETDRYLPSAAQYLIQNMLSPFKDGRIFTEKDMKLMVSICETCLNHEGLGTRAGCISEYYTIANNVLDKLIEWLGTTNRMKQADKLIPLIIKKYDEDEDEETLSSYNSRHIYEFAEHGRSTLAPYMDQLLTIYMDKKITDLLNPINMIYPENPKPMKKYFQKLLKELVQGVDQMVTTWLSQIFWEASKIQPELFTEANVKDILELINRDQTNQGVLLQIVQELSKRRPEVVVKHTDMLMGQFGMLQSWINDILCTLALYDKKLADKVMNHLLNSISTNQDKANLLTALNSIRVIGFKYVDILKPKRSEIEAFKTLDPDGQNMKQTILDLIDGKTTTEMQKQLQSQQDALTTIETRVDEVEGTVTEVKEEVGKQGEKLDNVTNTVTDQGQRLDQVEETVDDTVQKVEEIDSKTLSHAPYWSRDISKLLNPQAEHDWRLLSSRLGYSNNDIRGWAQQADPCMAMLNEWYATRKTSEATFAILNHLQEMDRMDAAVIVENAMKNAEAVVEDEDFVYASPPPIFISYQWGHQEEVKLLKRHLEMAGYECWLDIGQMGGGDKLFEKIDNGIRAAKVVISCITNKYTKSPNCNREVNLSVGLNKPIVPLLLEQCPWPPPGSMGPIFSESLFIRFFQRKGEETTDQRYWPQPKFLELLMQLNMNGVPPDEAKIEKVYKNWWMPIEQDIKIDKSKTKDGGQVSQSGKSDSKNMETECPEVFISYQWGKQKNIIKLYERLTSLGFSCWLDIKQMGGGDSLYDKIDKGIRGSKVVLSCVTQKYALSANCRREVSLADALKKPLLPLLLEKITWPPSGPMSMVMTQLLYIGFTEEKVQVTWMGPQFDELINKISEHVPRNMKEKPKEEGKEKPSIKPAPKPAAKSNENQVTKPSKTSTAKAGPAASQAASKEQNNKPKTVSQKPVQENSKEKDIVQKEKSPVVSKSPDVKNKNTLPSGEMKENAAKPNSESSKPIPKKSQESNHETPSQSPPKKSSEETKPLSKNEDSDKIEKVPDNSAQTSSTQPPKSKSCSIL